MKNYKEKYKRIKKFVNFNHDLRFSAENFEEKLSKRDKYLISYYNNVLFGNPKTAESQGAVNYDVYVYRPHSETNKRKAARAAQITGQYKELKAIPIPRANPNKKPKLKFKKDKLVIQEDNIRRELAYFNMTALAKNPEKEIKRAYDSLSEKDAVVIMAGFREILNQSAGTLDGLQEQVKIKMQRYSNYGQWLHGIIGYGFINQETYTDYLQERKKDNKKQKRKGKRNAKTIQRKKKNSRN